MNTDFKTKALQLVNSCKRVKGNQVYQTLAKEYNIGVRKAGDRFKSIFGKPVRDYLTDILIPSREQIRDALIKCNSQEELLRYLGVSYDRIVGVYDKYFGRSTFRKAKEFLLNEVDVVPYNPTLADNLSILVSQHLGDGYFDFSNNRSELKIEHGEKQFNYLKWKISLLQKAFPTLPGFEKIRKRISKTGYISYSYRTPNIRNKYFRKIREYSKEKLVKELTPLGWCLWYLDDGNLFMAKNATHLSIAISDPKIQEQSLREVTSYGIKASLDKNSLIISNRYEIIKFLNVFVKPFIHMIPECMKYKCVLKI